FGQAIEQGSTDPRIYYFRGLTMAASGDMESANNDYMAGALIEVSPQNRHFDVGVALERVQGKARMQIERARREARFLAEQIRKGNAELSAEDRAKTPVIPDAVPKTAKPIKSNLPDVAGVVNPGTPFDAPLAARTQKVIEKVAPPTTTPVAPTADDDPFGGGNASQPEPMEDDPFGDNDSSQPKTKATDDDPFGDSESSNSSSLATVAFEIRMAELMKNPLADMAKGTMESQAAAVPGAGDIENIKHIWGAVQLPNKLSDLQSLTEESELGALPMEMLIQVEMTDAAATDAMIAMLADDSNEVTKDGKKYYTPKDGPSNIMARKTSDTTMVIATTNYLNASADEALFSAGLKQAWNTFADEPIRIAVDLKTARPFIDEGMGMAKGMAPPMFQGMLGLVDKMNDLRISMDFKNGGNLVALGMSSGDDDSAEEIRSGIDGLLGMAKMMGSSQVESLRQMDEGMADVASKVLASLQAKRSGSDVQILIPKPEGFDKAMNSAMNMGGGGPDGF
ncbi:MAG: hypothetical protein P8J33_14570, partial [Pirellulaceae bacterium]|nr:hypothetical protein [Pirellulaceae bacterium]